MAEAFLEEIYKDAIVILQLQETLKSLYLSDNRTAMKKYNEAVLQIEQIIQKLSRTDVERAYNIQEVATDISERWEDVSFVSGILSGKLLPHIYSYMSFFTGINVEDGRYLLKSADTGFVTIVDMEINCHLHDLHDPMKEASGIADGIYRPESGKYMIFGCGLGYLPYVLWRRSGGTAKIVIYEEDEKLVQFANDFGVLAWIPPNDIEIVCIGDKYELLSRFWGDFDRKNKNDSVYIAPWKVNQYKEVNDNALSNLFEMVAFDRYVHDILVINIRKNYEKKFFFFSDFSKRFDFTEWVVVAAGPSFDDNLEFIKECDGNRGIIAVNTVLKRLTKEGIKPSLMVAADTNEQLVQHISGYEDFSIDIPLLADEATNWKYVEAYQGEMCFIPTPAGEGISISNPQNAERWDVSGTVSNLALEAAIRFGARKIYMIGMDFGYPKGKNYAEGMPHTTVQNKKGAMRVKAVDGSEIETSTAFNLFRLGVEKKISEHSEIEFINLSKHGALIEGAK